MDTMDDRHRRQLWIGRTDYCRLYVIDLGPCIAAGLISTWLRTALHAMVLYYCVFI
jgi:hypothetical protein